MGGPVSSVRIGNRWVGDGHPVYVVAEIGINHNGSLEIASAMIAGARQAGCDAVKFQKRTPELCVPRDQWSVPRSTPWGEMTYLEYKHRIEFGRREYAEIDRICRELDIDWFCSAWDEPSVAFLEEFDTPAYKISSASLTDADLRRVVARTGRPVILSTGMSTTDEIDQAVLDLDAGQLVITHSTSAYPCPNPAVNLRAMDGLRRAYPGCPVGYSGHEAGLAPTLAAVALGAVLVERHVTLDRSLWGTDQAASVDMAELARLVGGIREIEQSLGDGVKRVYECELPNLRKLRRVKDGAATRVAV